MEIFLLLFIALLTALSVLGFGKDSRDSADWRPSAGGLRRPPLA